MRFDIVREVFFKEVRETLRDRRSLAVMFGVPLLLYPLLTLGMAQLQTSTLQRRDRQAVRVAIENGAAAPHLIEQARAAGARVVDTEAADRALASGRADAILVVPPGAESKALAAEPVEITIRVDRSRTGSGFAEDKVHGVLQRYERWVIRQRLQARGIPESVVRPVLSRTEDVATSDRRLGSRLASLLPMMLLVTGMLGAFFPAINAATAERELGTLETLLVTPATKLELLTGKAAIVLLSGLLTAGLNMVSMSLVLWRAFSLASGKTELAIDPAALGLAYLAAVPTLIFFAGAVLVVGLFARTYREANSYATPVMLLSLVPMAVSMVEPKATPGLLVTPAVNSTIVIRQVLTGGTTPGAFALAFFSSCLYAGLMLSLAARLFTTENLVNPAWEPLSFKGSPARRSIRRLPAIDEALALFAVSMLLLFYLSPEFQRWGLIPLVTANELLMIAAPALVFARIGRYRWAETFSWRPARPSSLIGGALLGIGIVPWVIVIASWQDRIWPRGPEQAVTWTKVILPSLQSHPVATVVLVGLLAGVCEEIFYRGPIQAAFVKRFSARSAVGITAVLFAAAHLDLHGMPMRTVLGFMLGWMVLRGGSVFPAMVAHALIDSTNLAFVAIALRTMGEAGFAAFAANADPLAGPWSGYWIAALIFGGAAAIVGWRLAVPRSGSTGTSLAND